MTTTTYEELTTRVQTQITKLRWALGLSGALSIALAVTIIVWPGISLHALVIAFGAYALARGIVGIVAALGNPDLPSRGWLVAGSIAGIVVGVLVFTNTGLSALALLYVIGSYAIVVGVVAIGNAFVLPLSGGDSVLLGLTGLVSILFGIIMFAEPGDGAIAVLALIAAYALIVGLAELTVAIGGKRVLGLSERRSAGTTPQGSSR
jgi:uncharacterized membrane protein HdeD (DUF308 family)